MNILDDFLQNGLNRMSDETRKAYRYSLTRFQGFLGGSGGSLDNLTQMDIQQYIDYLQKILKRTASTVRREYAPIATFAKWSKQSVALIDVRLPKAQNPNDMAPKSLDRLDRNALLRDIQRTQNVRNIAIVYMLYFCGLRVGELVRLDREDVYISERTGMLRVLGKGNKERKVPIDPKARTFLNQYLDSRDDCCEALFVNDKRADKQRLTVRTIERILAKHGVHPHMLRHTYAKELVDENVPLTVVAKLLGHSDVKVTSRYAAPKEEDLYAAVSKLGQ